MSKRYTAEQNRIWLDNLPRKKVAVKVILKSNRGNILLVKPDYKDTWQLPGGGVDSNEDPKITAKREVMEEVSIKVDTQDLRIVDIIFKADDDYLFLMFESRKLYDENADYSVEDEEIEGYKFVPQKEVPGLLPQYYQDFWSKYSSQS